MNRKGIIIVLAIVIILVAAVSISATNVQSNFHKKTATKTGLYCNFTDDNDDGICDNCNNTNPKCDGTKQHIRNHTQGQLADKNSQQCSNQGVCDPQTGNQYGKHVSSSSNGGHGQSSSSSNSGYHYGQSSSSSNSGSGNQYGKSASSSSTHSHGQSGNGQHSQQRLHVRDC